MLLGDPSCDESKAAPSRRRDGYDDYLNAIPPVSGANHLPFSTGLLISEGFIACQGSEPKPNGCPTKR